MNEAVSFNHARSILVPCDSKKRIPSLENFRTDRFPFESNIGINRKHALPEKYQPRLDFKKEFDRRVLPSPPRKKRGEEEEEEEGEKKKRKLIEVRESRSRWK